MIEPGEPEKMLMFYTCIYTYMHIHTRSLYLSLSLFTFSPSLLMCLES